jgi:ureidoglycolate lyase
MDGRRELSLTELTPQSFADYGVVLGSPPAATAVAYASPASDFWRQHLFAAGGRDPELLWVTYRDVSPRIDRLERHKLTEQAVVPLTGPVIQIVAAPTPADTPDADSVRAFHVPVGMGLCMRPGCWHAARVPVAEAICLMLTRASTTVDLISHLTAGAPLIESAYGAVALQLAPRIG